MDLVEDYLGVTMSGRYDPYTGIDPTYANDAKRSVEVSTNTGAPRIIRKLPAELKADVVYAHNMSNKYLLSTWIPARFPGTGSILLATFGGITEVDIRPACAAVLSLAISLKTGTYNAAVTGVSEVDAIASTMRLLKGLGAAHRTTVGGGWGNVWQSQLWAAMFAQAADLMWADYLTDTTAQTRVQNSISSEASIFRDVMQPLYWKKFNGVEMYPGDTKAEENAWIGYNHMMVPIVKPADVNVNGYSAAALRYFLSANSMPHDISGLTQIHGVVMADKFDGWNINEDGTVTNHDRIHPDYMASMAQLAWGAGLYYAYKGVDIPGACVLNAETIYAALSKVRFNDKTIYTPGSGDIYYPAGNDYGSSRYMDKVQMDITAHCLALDTESETSALEWARLHLDRVLEMQDRFTDGHMYLNDSEDNYPGKEQWVPWLLALSVLSDSLPDTARFGYSAPISAI